MKMIDSPNLYIHWLNKPANRTILEHFARDKDKDVKKFISLFLWLVATLRETPAWNKPKTNIMIQTTKAKLEATIARAKKGTSSGYGVAGVLINTIDHWGSMELNCGRPPEPNPGVPADLEQFEAELKKLLVAVV